jgi:hypothetical protein
MNENQAAGRSKRSRLKALLRGSDHSCQSSRAPSPVPSRGKADNASVTAGASSSTPEIRPSVGHDAQLVARANATIPAIKLDDRLDGKSDGDQNVESDDMWEIAKDQLRQDEKMNKLLDAYYDILNSKLKDLETSGNTERQTQKQVSTFIVSVSESFRDTSKLGTFASVLKKAADCILMAEKVISAAAQPCLPASIACAGVMLVLSVSSSLRLYAPDADAQTALRSSRQSAGRSLQRPG